MRIDKTDRRILRELDKDSRQSLVSISKTLRIPPETVRYRLQRLLDSGVIQNFIPVIDGGKLGFYYYKIFFKLYNVSEQDVEEIISDLCQNPSVNWVVRVDGAYDIGFTVKVNNPVELSNLTDEIRANYHVYIHSWKYSVNIKMDFLSRDYLTPAPRKIDRRGAYTASTDLYSLDEIGWSIINRLGKAPRKSAAEIAKGLSIGPDAVALRIKQLERDEVIVRYTVVLDNQKMGQFNYYVLVYLNAIARDKEMAFVDYCRSKECIPYIIKSLGEWDFELSVEVASVQEYRELMMDITKEFRGIIRDYDGMNVARIHKYVYP